LKKYIYILALAMANPENQHCANCIGTLSFPIARTDKQTDAPDRAHYSDNYSGRPPAKLVAALLRVARVTAGLAESTGNLPPGL